MKPTILDQIAAIREWLDRADAAPPAAQFGHALILISMLTDTVEALYKRIRALEEEARR